MDLATLVAESKSYTEVLRKQGKSPVGGNVTYLKLQCKRKNIDTSHMTGQAHARGKVSSKKKTPAERLVLGTPLDYRQNGAVLTRTLIEIGHKHQCSECGLSEWRGNTLTLEVDHINSRYWDNRAENLRFLCPNCHSLIPNRVKKS